MPHLLAEVPEWLLHPSGPSIIPALQSGPAELPPAAWAECVKEIPWPCVRWGFNIYSELIKRIQHMPAMREPVLRLGLTWTGEDLNRYLRRDLRRVEAIYIFTVGQVAQNKCQLCERGGGMFPFCVVVGSVGCASCYVTGIPRSKASLFPTVTTVFPAVTTANRTIPRPIACQLEIASQLETARQLETTRQTMTNMRHAQATLITQIASIQSAYGPVREHLNRRLLPFDADVSALEESIDGRHGSPSLAESLAAFNTEMEKVLDAFAALPSCP